MPVVFPDKRRAAISQSPGILLIYGPPKIGKTEMVARLPDCLIIDTERGTREHECMPVEVETLTEFAEVTNHIRNKTLELRKTQPRGFVYKYIVIDTVDELEELCIRYLTAVYNMDVEKNPTDKDGKRRSKLKSIYELPYGMGHWQVREEVKGRIRELGKYCRYVILISHVKDKFLTEKTGADIVDTEISLTGKLSTIIMSLASAIGYAYRDDSVMVDYKGAKVPQLMLSFETVQDRASAGSRSSHLAGKRIPFEWSKIYIDDQVPETIKE